MDSIEELPTLRLGEYQVTGQVIEELKAPEKVKLTKSALNKFIIWSTSRYNSYLGFGSKRINVDEAYGALKQGFLIQRIDGVPQRVTKYNIECTQGVGEGQNYRYWRLKGRPGDYKYEIDCVERTVTGLPSGMKIQFS